MPTHTVPLLLSNSGTGQKHTSIDQRRFDLIMVPSTYLALVDWYCPGQLERNLPAGRHTRPSQVDVPLFLRNALCLSRWKPDYRPSCRKVMWTSNQWINILLSQLVRERTWMSFKLSSNKNRCRGAGVTHFRNQKQKKKCRRIKRLQYLRYHQKICLRSAYPCLVETWQLLLEHRSQDHSGCRCFSPA